MTVVHKIPIWYSESGKVLLKTLENFKMYDISVTNRKQFIILL